MTTLINKDKQISKQRQEFVEHNFEAMVGARKRRYNDTASQKQRTEFFEDYYLLYTRNKHQLDQQKAMWNELKEWLGRVNQVYMNDGFVDCAGAICEVIDKIQELEQGENK